MMKNSLVPFAGMLAPPSISQGAQSGRGGMGRANAQYALDRTIFEELSFVADTRQSW
jgi:hypothetical protein